MIKQFLFKLQKKLDTRKIVKDYRKSKYTPWQPEEERIGRIIAIDTSYKITEVELEVLRQGNKKLYIQHINQNKNLKIRKKLDRVLNDTEIERINEVLDNMYFEETNCNLYLVTCINLRNMRGFNDIKNTIEIFKRRAEIVKGIIWS